MKRLMSIVLSFILAFLLVGSNSVAKAGTERMTEYYTPQDNTEPEIVEEMESLRTPSSKTYRLSDGEYRYVAYAEDVHYLSSNGLLSEIDNSLVVSSDDGYMYTNVANSWNVSFGETQIKLIKDEYGIVMSLPSGEAKPTVKLVKEIKDWEMEVYEKYLDNSIVYSYQGFDIVYSVLTGALKEDIVIYDKESLKNYSFSVKVSNGLQVLNENGVHFINGAGEDVFGFADMFMYDAKGKLSDNVSLICEKRGDYYSFTINPDRSFFSEDTQYPVVIDPSVIIRGTANTYDTFVNEEYPTLNYNLSTRFWVGGAVSNNRKRALFDFSLPSDLYSKKVTRASIQLRKDTDTNPSIQAFIVAESWDPEDVTWLDQPDYYAYLHSDTCSSLGYGWYGLDVTQLVIYFLQNSYPYYGFLLKEAYENNPDQKTRFYSSDSSYEYAPMLIVDYVNSYGTRPYQETNTTLVNCMGYALELFDWISAYDLGIDTEQLYGSTADQIALVVSSAASTWMYSHLYFGNYTHILHYDSDLTYSPGAFRVVVRVGFLDTNGNGVFDQNDQGQKWDYHWRYQTNNGTGFWADKPGQAKSRLFNNEEEIDPGLMTWSGYVNYTSTCYYFQIRDMRDIAWPVLDRR